MISDARWHAGYMVHRRRTVGIWAGLRERLVRREGPMVIPCDTRFNCRLRGPRSTVCQRPLVMCGLQNASWLAIWNHQADACIWVHCLCAVQASHPEIVVTNNQEACSVSPYIKYSQFELHNVRQHATLTSIIFAVSNRRYVTPPYCQ